MKLGSIRNCLHFTSLHSTSPYHSTIVVLCFVLSRVFFCCFFCWVLWLYKETFQIAFVCFFVVFVASILLLCPVRSTKCHHLTKSSGALDGQFCQSCCASVFLFPQLLVLYTYSCLLSVCLYIC